MSTLNDLEKISRKYSDSAEEFIRSGVILNLKEKQRLLQIERFEILSRYQATTVDELNQKITEGKAPEHPGWEDLIELKNIEAEIKEIENDIKIL
ncbi:MAG: hypothetical protein H8D42_04235 [Candidatus Marinimicrobia bacterium]|nr:hypothetical protein [Candidatus Neomarinimicrobiota bacterium]